MRRRRRRRFFFSLFIIVGIGVLEIALLFFFLREAQDETDGLSRSLAVPQGNVQGRGVVQVVSGHVEDGGLVARGLTDAESVGADRQVQGHYAGVVEAGIECAKL